MKHLALCEMTIESGDAMNALPCPFCAAVELSITELFEPDESLEAVSMGFIVKCDTCYANGPMNENESAAVVDWNTRYFYQDNNDAPWQIIPVKDN